MTATAELRDAIREDMRQALQVARERRIERDLAAQRAVDRQTGKVANYALLAAQQRDELTRAQDYPMSDAELVAACHAATRAAKIPEASFDDVTQALAEKVMQRHGRNPKRVDVQPTWLRRRALTIHIDAERQTETATGRRESAEQLRDWKDADHREAMTEAAASGDAVYALAANTPAPDMAEVRATAERIAQELQRPDTGNLTHLQADAVRVALSVNRTRPMTNNQRQTYWAATAILRKRFHTADAVRCAIRPIEYSAGILANAAIKAERERASVATHGSHLGGGNVTASWESRT